MAHRDNNDPVPTFLDFIAAIKLKFTLHFYFQKGTVYWFKSWISSLCFVINKVWVKWILKALHSWFIFIHLFVFLFLQGPFFFHLINQHICIFCISNGCFSASVLACGSIFSTLLKWHALSVHKYMWAESRNVALGVITFVKMKRVTMKNNTGGFLTTQIILSLFHMFFFFFTK